MTHAPRTPWLALAPILVAALAVAGCNDDDDTVTGPDPNRVYVQVERLGNPLTSEVFFPKRDHGLHNTTAPTTDAANDFGGRISAFAAAFDRSTTIQNTLATVLVPDVLVVYPNRPGSGAGWLSWALAGGYGGRRLQDDVVDAGLSAIFGTLVDPSAGAVPGLTSDNVPPSVRQFSGTFPYLESPRP
ncbi:MAG: DUF4331 family protein [Gemmatimonadaceae bacterium]